jgi:hypothetical protein
MNLKEANAIIANYRPRTGFFDLSEKPATLSNIKYAQILHLQDILAYNNEHSDYLKKYDPVQWQKCCGLSATLQQLIFRYWGETIYLK